MKTSKFFAVVLIIAILSTSFLRANATSLSTGTTDSGYLHLKKLSKAEIVDLVEDQNLPEYNKYYIETPLTTAPYSLGIVRTDMLQAGLDRLNAYRRLAGIYSVTMTDTYTNYAQAAALSNAAINTMTHYPTQAEGMPDDLYEMGAYGARTSNIACYMGYRPAEGPVSFSVDLWMNDSDSYNIDKLGHRRWALNPTMQSTGFGCATATSGWVYTAMFAFDSNAYAYDYDYISWPPSGYMVNDTAFFSDEHAWSVTLNPCNYSFNFSNINITLKNSEGNTWTFNKNEADGYFNTDLGGYGCAANAIIFRPNGISTYSGTYTVKIDGIYDINQNPTQLCYTVDFFSAEEFKGNQNPDENTTIPENPSTNKPTTQPSTKETTTFTDETTTKPAVTETTTLTFPTEENTTSVNQDIILGDANNDKKINASDARIILRISAKLAIPTQEQLLASDVTKDGKITAADARKVLRVAARLESFENSETGTTAQNSTTNNTTTTETITEAPTTKSPETTEKTEQTTQNDDKYDTVFITPTGKKYHDLFCRTLQGVVSGISRENAEKAGYEPCKVCNP